MSYLLLKWVYDKRPIKWWKKKNPKKFYKNWYVKKQPWQLKKKQPWQLKKKQPWQLKKKQPWKPKRRKPWQRPLNLKRFFKKCLKLKKKQPLEQKKQKSLKEKTKKKIKPKKKHPLKPKKFNKKYPRKPHLSWHFKKHLKQILKHRVKRYFKKARTKLGFPVSDLIFLNWFLGYLNKKGKKSVSYHILTSFFLLLKRLNKGNPRNLVIRTLVQIKPSILLFNKKRGTLVFELPRLLTIEQSTKKVIEWLVKYAKKGKSNMSKNLFVEFENIQLNRGDVVKKNLNIVELALKNRPFFYLLKKKK